MSRLPEQRLWDRIRSNLGREIAIERIENTAGAGTPDTLIIFKGKVTFAEHKTATLPMRPTSKLRWRHELTPQQRNWHRMWHQNGGTSFIVVGIGEALHAIPGEKVDTVHDMTEQTIATWRIDMKLLGQLYRREF